MCHVPDGKRNQSYEQSYRQFGMHRLQNGVLQSITRRPAVRHMCGWQISRVYRPVDLHAVQCGPVLAFSRRNDAYGLPSLPAGQVLCRGQDCLHRLRAWQLRDGRGGDDMPFVQCSRETSQTVRALVWHDNLPDMHRHKADLGPRSDKVF